jgi:hypothetical protein
MVKPRDPQPGHLPADHQPTGVAFLDESGAIAKDRFFTVGCLKLAQPSVLLRQIQRLRDQQHWYGELHWIELTRTALRFYKDVVDVVAASDASFSCFVADRQQHDPVSRFGTPWAAYQRLAEQLILGSISQREILTVLADNYSTPAHVMFEEDLKRDVNRRLGRLGVLNVCRLDSRSTDALQVVDLLTSAVTFEFRQSAGLAGTSSPKAQLADYVRTTYGVRSCMLGCRCNGLNVALYEDTATKRPQAPGSQ